MNHQASFSLKGIASRYSKAKSFLINIKFYKKPRETSLQRHLSLTFAFLFNANNCRIYMDLKISFAAIFCSAFRTNIKKCVSHNYDTSFHILSISFTKPWFQKYYFWTVQKNYLFAKCQCITYINPGWSSYALKPVNQYL